MIKVLSLASYQFLPARVGGQKGIALFNKYLSRHVSLTTVTTRNNDPSMAEGYAVLPILSTSKLRYINLFYFFTLRGLIREQGFTHLLLEHPYYGWLGAWLKRATGVKLIVHSHNIEGLRWKSQDKWWWKIMWNYERWTHRHADYNFFIQDNDKDYAINHFSLRPEKCITATYGIERNAAPGPAERQAAKHYVRERHAIPPEHAILLFNGAFNYRPNLRALECIVNIIHPLLFQHRDFHYTIVICGRDIPDAFSSRRDPQIVYAGFVDDISTYFKGADVFLNPVSEGGGIKTKLVEALGNGLSAVSLKEGAIGVDPSLCNGKLFITENDDWQGFSRAIVQLAREQGSLPQTFLDRFYWDHIADRAARFIEK